MDTVENFPIEAPAITSLGGSMTGIEEVNLSQKQKRKRKKKKHGKAVELDPKDKGPDLSLDNSSMKTDAIINDPLHESLAMPNLLSSERIEELNSTKKNQKRKRTKTRLNAIESNVDGCGVRKDTFSTETSTPALDMPSEHPIRCMSTDPERRQSCAGRDFCHQENEGKEHNMFKRATESSNRQHDLQKVSSTQNSVVANAEGFIEESVFEVVKLKVEQSINAGSSNPEDKNGFVKNASLMKKHDDNPAVYHISKKSQNLTTYRRRNGVESNCGINSGYPISVTYNKEPIMQDHYNDDSHNFADGPLTVGLMEKGTELSMDQVTSNSGAAVEETKFTTDNTSDQRFVTTSSVVDISVVQLQEAYGRQLDHSKITRNGLCSAGDVADLSLVSIKDDHPKISHFPLDTTITSNSKKLLVLDVNGLLADFVSYVPRGYRQPDFKISRRAVYKRPFCDGFLQFCFDKFHVGVWSSRAKTNVDTAIKFLMRQSASKLLFCWNQSHCTTTKFSTVENKTKPLVLKELRKLWEKLEPDLPWEKGEFNESNTLLLDDSPYKALGNPRYTAVFPYSYQFTHTKDKSLGPGGNLRVYLEGLAMAENVQEYVASNPFGQRAITESNPSWRYYSKVIEAVKRRQNARASSSGKE